MYEVVADGSEPLNLLYGNIMGSQNLAVLLEVDYSDKAVEGSYGMRSEHVY